ncbi:cation:proton antiporter [Candidatus Peregrinibacteria bacterium]|nr:cation:proton antiporter [Candidatus Peregrinibacteria bacterium]
MKNLLALVSVLAISLFPSLAHANSGGSGPDVNGMVMGLLIATAACVLLAWLCSKFKLPAILGWIVAGVVVGNLPIQSVHHLVTDPNHDSGKFLGLIGELGVVLLMFKAGLEAKPDAIKKNLIGASSVAVLGILLVGLVGFIVAKLLLPAGSHWLSYVYVAAALTPTSAGIGAAIFAEKKQASSAEGVTVLVAAVLDDVLGLVVMAVMTALALTAQSGKPIEAGPIAIEALKGISFVGIGVGLGVWVLPKFIGSSIKVKTPGLLLPIALVVCLSIAWFGSWFGGLAPLIGAYVAGLIFEQVRYKDEDGEFELEHAVEPLVALTAPVFFLLLGTKVKLLAFANPTVLLLAGALILATLIGKIGSGLGVIGGAKRWPVVAGMMPRGEVAAIMVKGGAAISIGGTALISEEVFTAFILMIAGTTILSIIGLNKLLPNNDQAGEKTSH